MAAESPVLMRDTLIVNNDLRTRLFRLCRGQVAGAIVVLAARRVEHQPADFVLRLGPVTGQVDLTGLNIVIVADEYDAPQGSINADGVDGVPQGTDDVPGADTEDESRDGGGGAPEVRVRTAARPVESPSSPGPMPWER